MKKSMLVLTAALMFGGMATAQTAATASAPQVPALTDVPAGHWAKDAIDKLVSRGIILGYPDGTFRGTQNLTRYEAAVIIARLLDQMGSGTGPSLDADTITSLQNAVQELAADLAALGVRVSDLEENAVTKDDFSRLEARVEELAAAGGSGSGEAVSGIQTQIDDLTARVDEVAGNYDTLRADVDDNASSIAALNDLTVLLNQDILDLQDRVSAVEAAQADFVLRSDFDNLSTKVTGIDTRVTTLEKAPKFSVSGSIVGTYGRIALTSGTANFDISRLLYGTWGAGVFDTRSDICTGTDTTSNCDTSWAYTSEATGVRFGIKVSNLTTANGKVIVNNATVNMRTANAWNILGKVGTGITVSEPYVFVNDASADGTIDGQKFNVMYHRILADFKFQNYLFDNMDGSGTRRGMVATVEATKLPGAPTITLVTGSTTSAPMLANGQTSGNYWGVSTQFKVGDGGKFAVNYGQVDFNRAAAGYDADLKFGAFSVRSEAVLSVPNSSSTFLTGGGSLNNLREGSDGMIYVEGRADLGMFKLGANYRAINPLYLSGSAGDAGMNSSDDRPYVANQIGYGAALATDLGPLTVGAYVDHRADWYGNAPVTGFGVKAGAKFGALEAVVFANRLTDTGVLTDGIKLDSNPYTADAVATIDDRWLPGSGTDYNINAVGTGMGLTKIPFEMTSTFGTQLSHDGGASNALVKNLNFTVGDAYYYASKTNSFYAFGDYTLSAGGFTVKPLLRFHSVMNSAIKDDLHNLTVIKGGVKVSSPVLTSVPLQPSFFANAVGRSTKGNVTGIQTSEVFAQAGVSLNRLFADGLSADLGYSYYAGKNVAYTDRAYDTTDPFSTSLDRVYGAAIAPTYFNGSTALFNNNGVKTTGLFTRLAWNGLSANWGIFKSDSVQNTWTRTGAGTATDPYVYTASGAVPSSSVAQAFKVNYSFRF